MPRPIKCRRICALPRHSRFQSDGDKAVATDLTLEEFEVLRLIDYAGLGQAQCAAQMGVARTTVQRIYETARQKLTRFLVEGGTLQISGGVYALCPQPNCRCERRDCGRRHCGCVHGECSHCGESEDERKENR